MHNDSLYRVSFKCLIEDDQGRILVVKESGRSNWDLPGGGIEHDETIKESIRRELKEEISYEGDFTYEVVKVDEPLKLLSRDVWQLKIIVKVQPDSMNFRVGSDADEISFIYPSELQKSENESERRVYTYSNLPYINQGGQYV